MFACNTVCTKALVNTELKKQSSENACITEVKVTVHSETRLLQIIGLEVGDTQEIKSFINTGRENKPSEYRQWRDQKEERK